MAFVEMFGAELLTKDGLKSTQELLSGKSTVGVYFSAHWCPECRGFTPKLAEMYSSAFLGKGMELDAEVLTVNFDVTTDHHKRRWNTSGEK